MELHQNFMWSSDWDGHEVGYPDIPVVGLYTLRVNPNIDVYINMGTLEILEAWTCSD